MNERTEIIGFDLLLLVAIWYKTQSIWYFLLILFLMTLVGIVFYFIFDYLENRNGRNKEN